MSLNASHSWLGQSRVVSRRKGLTNDLGENNCFLNVIIQSLWHLRSCRVLIATGDHALHHRFGGKTTKLAQEAAARGSCLLCELEQIFILYQFAEEPVLEVDRVRLALGNMFQLGAMNDATETLEAILDALHWDTFNRMLALRRGHQCLSMDELSQSSVEDASSIICEPQCIAHLLFQMNLMELKSCRQCGETNEPLMNTDFLYRVYAQELLNYAKGKSLEDVLRLEAQGGCIAEECMPTCDACKSGAKMQQSRWILQLPMVFAISIIWSSDHVQKNDVKAWMELLSSQNSRAKKNQDDELQTLDLGRIFRLDTKPDEQAASDYNFRGMVCYYGRHYVGFFKSRSVENGVSGERWFLFDDTRVKPVGNWDEVRSRIERGVYQPTLLFYERKGIKQESLEKFATEIHQWWEQSAEAIDEANRKESSAPVSNGASTPASSLGSPVEPKAVSPKEHPASPKVPTTNTLVPISPIKADAAPVIPPALSQNGGRSWLEEDIFLMHQSAQDTLSRLNGILSREVKSTKTPDLGASMSMPRSIRRREYSFHRPDEAMEEINRDDIFRDHVDPPSTKLQTLLEESEPVVARVIAELESVTLQPQQTSADGREVQLPSKVFDVQLTASDGGLGLVLEEASEGSVSVLKNGQKGIVVSGFEMSGAGDKLAAEASGAIEPGDELIGINGHVFEKEALINVLEMLWTAPNPVRLTFHRYMPWTCPRCTLLNDVGLTTCAACSSEVQLSRGALVKKPLASG
ncbi:hypothetical protein Poli38472_007973 [Pythium oligandrum]|uniref:Inactive ubiquitin carboxyl-terminal hydrolase 54 n=1 Tax=Pythium oligandrum TaxID=41045 RepID=A0A8K1CKK6_PYTOL|nr:hypothetical protein Poli38472_007973 [Pythium oligandrum]|eukprot:TMW65331.1 hypothetical protein Poli38472_007973 [Pythium oligandrum]